MSQSASDRASLSFRYPARGPNVPTGATSSAISPTEGTPSSALARSSTSSCTVLSRTLTSSPRFGPSRWSRHTYHACFCLRDRLLQVLGLFARGDTFNGETEEQLIEEGLVIEERAGTKEGRLLLYGGRPGTRSFNPPSAAELGKMALLLIKRFSNAAGKPFFAALELESTDDFPNIANVSDSDNIDTLM